MDRDKEMELETVIDAIDTATAPTKMSKAEALEFLEEIEGQLTGRMEALREEIEEEEDN